MLPFYENVGLFPFQLHIWGRSMLIFFEDSFFLPVVQESNTIQSNKRLYKAYTYHSLKCA